MSRPDVRKIIEIELSRVRDLAEHPDDQVLRYLIDVAISEAQQNSQSSTRDDKKNFSGRRSFSKVVQYPAYHKA